MKVFAQNGTLDERPGASFFAELNHVQDGSWARMPTSAEGLFIFGYVWFDRSESKAFILGCACST